MTARNERILVIDDDRDIRDIIRLILELEGFKVDVLDNGHFVDETILSFKPQLILLDVMLGSLNRSAEDKLLFAGWGLRVKFNKGSNTNIGIDYAFSQNYRTVILNPAEAF